jgi:HAD superfamily hydrolase (TIGR01509 family)
VTGPGLVALDVGFTLVRGPDEGPARRIARRAGLGDAERRALHAALMTKDFEDPAAVAAFAREDLGIAAAGLEEAIAAVWDAQEREARPVPGAADALTKLKARGVRLALISNIWRPFLTSARRHLGAVFDECVAADLQVFSFQAGYAKPSPEIFMVALEAAGVPAEEAVMVGDSYDKDIRPAAALGMATILTLTAPAEEHEVDRTAPLPSRSVTSIAAVDFQLLAEIVSA